MKNDCALCGEEVTDNFDTHMCRLKAGSDEHTKEITQELMLKMMGAFGLSLLGIKKDTQTKDKVTEQVSKTLRNYEGQGHIRPKDYDVTKVDVLWNTWTLKQKAIWFLMNKIFTWVARNKRAMIDELNSKLDVDSDEYYERVKYPYWASSSPLATMIVDMEVALTQPIECIKINLTVGQEECE